MLSPIAAACRWSPLVLSPLAGAEIRFRKPALTQALALGAGDGNRTRTISLGIGQIVADEAAEQPTWETPGCMCMEAAWIVRFSAWSA